MSENDESNIEAPSPVTPVKSPDKSQDSPPMPVKKDGSSSEIPSLISNSTEGVSTPPSPVTPPSVHELPPVVAASSPSTPIVEAPPTVKLQAVVKPAILRFGATPIVEEYSSAPSTGVGVFGHNVKSQVQGKEEDKMLYDV